ARYNVLPLDWRGAQRLNSEAMGRPTLGGDAKTFTYYPGQVGLPNEGSPRILNKSWTITTVVEVPEKAEGMIVTQGGLEGGYGLYLREGKPTFVYNYLSLERPTFAAKQPLPAGKAKIVVDFVYDGKRGEIGRGGTISLSVNGQTVDEGKLERTAPIALSIGE